MRDHVAYECDKACMYPCMFCQGGLFECINCHSFEDATTSECPGYRMTQDQIDRVYAGKLDYRDGRWIEAASGSCSSHYGMPGCPL